MSKPKYLAPTRTTVPAIDAAVLPLLYAASQEVQDAVRNYIIVVANTHAPRVAWPAMGNPVIRRWRAAYAKRHVVAPITSPAARRRAR